MTALDNVVVLNSKRYPLAQSGVEQTLTQFPPKTLEGVPTAADHTLTGTFGFGNFSGGWGLYAYQPGGARDRFWYSSADTRWPTALMTLPTVATTDVGGAVTYSSTTEGGWAACVEASGGETRPLWYSGAVYQVAAANFATSGFGTSWSTPLTTKTLITGISYITDSVSFQGGQLFACADSNHAPIAYRYCATDVTSTPTISTSVPLAMKFAVLGENVYMAGHKSGDAKTIYISTSTAPYSSSTWTDILSFQRDDKDKSLQFFVQGFSLQGLPCFYLGTGRSIFQIDIVRGVAQKIFSFPRFYSAGDAASAISACVWQKTQSLYVGQGYNLWEIGGSIKNIAPGADGDGLPNGQFGASPFSDYKVGGIITDVFARREALCCVLSPTGVSQEAGLVLEWRGAGWHTLMVGTNSNVAPGLGRGIALNDSVVIRADNLSSPTGTRLWGLYDLDSDIPVYARKTTQLSSAFTTGLVMAPFFDAGFPVDKKAGIACVTNGGPADLQLQMKYTPPAGSLSTNAVFTLSDYDQTHESLLTSTAAGLEFERMTLFIQVDKGTGSSIPYGLVKSVGFKYLLRPKQLYGFNVTIDLSFVGLFEGRSADALKAELKTLMDTSTPFTFTFNSGPSEVTRYVAASAFSGPMTLTPLDPQSIARLTLLEPRPYAGFVQ